MSDDDPLLPTNIDGAVFDRYALSTAIYAERDDGTVLLIQRAEGSALAGQFYLPGGLVDAGEDPWTAVERELVEETGLRLAGPLRMVGCYPMFVYGERMLQLTFRAPVAGEVELSHEHTDSVWITPADVAALFTPEYRAELAAGNEQVAELLEGIAADFERYLAAD